MLRARTLALLAASCGLVAVALACLPDLTPPPTDTCGSGIVDLARGEACDPGDAGALGCTASCAIECEGGAIDDASGHCYFWIPGVDSYPLGKSKCGAAGGHVVSLGDPDEVAFVLAHTKGLPNAPSGTGTWLALEQQSLTNEAGAVTYFSGLELPGWAWTCPGCYANVEAGATDIPRPTNGNPQACVDWRRNGGSWVQAGCALGFNDSGVLNTTSILCEREPPGSFASPCPDDDAGAICARVPTTFGKKRYVLGPPSSFEVARAACAARGGLLAHFESAAEREEVLAAFEPFLVASDVWIGLAFDADAGAWKWDDGAPAPAAFPTPWADLEPSQNAGAASVHLDIARFDTHLARARSDTSETLPFVCQLAD